MKKYLYIPLLLLFTSVLFAAYEELVIDNIHIYFSPRRTQLADFTINTIQNQIPKLEKIFGKKTDQITIYISDSRDQFARQAGSHLPYWTAAVTLFPDRKIVLKNPALTNSTLRQFRETVEHEFFHFFQGITVPLNITPTWFNEGLASYFSYPYDIQSRIILSQAVFHQQVIPLEQLSDFLAYNHLQAELAYAESASVIEYLIAVYGEFFIREIFLDLSVSHDFNSTINRLTGNDLDTFEVDWKKFISQRYRWIFLLEIHNIIWLIIPILVIIVYFIKRQRNKVTIQQWNIEENLEDINPKI